ncbi:hypothetical protein GCM10020331_062130 [Ectobacillus funiculus]
MACVCGRGLDRVYDDCCEGAGRCGNGSLSSFAKTVISQKARHSLGMIVGRDTADLDESEISRGAVETVAEKYCRCYYFSVIFFALIGGAPLAMAYRAVNTLDSMVGYKKMKHIVTSDGLQREWMM